MRKSLATVIGLLLAFSTLAGATSAAPNGSPWGASYFPNVPLVTQEGKTVLFYEDLLKDKKVLINFIFTRCKDACPLDTAKLRQVQRLLGSRVGREVFMYSITLDPEHDTPEALKAYAGKFGVGPGWLFLTGKREDLDRVRFKLGERNAKEEHANTVRVGDVAAGRWMRLPLTADPNVLLVEIAKTLDSHWLAGKPLKSIEEAPRPEIPVQAGGLFQGQLLFRNRCAACHTLGAGDRIGPDLKDVAARREPVWLRRFLRAPDQMRASKDSIALELAKRYPVPMPNLSLTLTEVETLAEYLEAQSANRREPGSTPSAAAPVASQTAADRNATATELHQHGTGRSSPSWRSSGGSIAFASWTGGRPAPTSSS